MEFCIKIICLLLIIRFCDCSFAWRVSNSNKRSFVVCVIIPASIADITFFILFSTSFIWLFIESKADVSVAFSCNSIMKSLIKSIVLSVSKFSFVVCITTSSNHFFYRLCCTCFLCFSILACIIVIFFSCFACVAYHLLIYILK